MDFIEKVKRRLASGEFQPSVIAEKFSAVQPIPAHVFEKLDTMFKFKHVSKETAGNE